MFTFNISVFVALFLAAQSASAFYTGSVAYWFQNGQTTACGEVYSDSEYTAAISNTLFAQGKCGDNIWLYNPGDGTTFSVVVSDIAWDSSDSDIVLSIAAFEQLSGPGSAGLDYANLGDIDWDFY